MVSIPQFLGEVYPAVQPYTKHEQILSGTPTEPHKMYGLQSTAGGVLILEKVYDFLIHITGFEKLVPW